MGRIKKDGGNVTRLSNFGENVHFQPEEILSPRSESELLQMMAMHRGRKIRVVGSKHSWSQVVCCDDILVDLRYLNSVDVRRTADQVFAEIGAGCTIEHALSQLNQQGLTLPSLGLITKQTIAGAMATGTHGSGRHSLSHYLRSAEIAHYRRESNEPVLQTVDRGDELLAARCALGSLGIMTSVTIPVISQFQIEEHFARHRDLDSVLAAEAAFPLQQFYFAPWRWDYFAQHRRPVTASRSWLAPAYRMYWSAGMDRAFHWLVLALVRIFPFAVTKFFYRRVLGWLIPLKWKVTDRSDRQLTMQHQLFRHIEIEIFVTRSRLHEAMKFVEWIIKHAAGETDLDDKAWETMLSSSQLWQQTQSLRGQYRHHYPICIRKVLADETLISMASGAEDYYAISLISYARPTQRQGFELFAQVIAKTMATLFQARPHWGKFCPLGVQELRKLYPDFEKFLEVKKEFDSSSIFDNSWTEELFRQPTNG